MKTASELLCGVTEVTGVTACNGGDISATPTETPEVTGVTESPIPSLENRPCTLC